MLSTIYKKRFTTRMKTNIRSLAFAGTVVGQLAFGYTSDHISRKWSLVTSTVILVVFATMCTGAYGYHGSFEGMIAALSAYRFLLGIGIGGEYPAGSVGAAEHSGGLKSGTRNRWFILFTNVQIDLGWVLAYLVAMIVVRLFFFLLAQGSFAQISLRN
jgi:MFS family permease